MLWSVRGTLVATKLPGNFAPANVSKISYVPRFGPFRSVVSFEGTFVSRDDSSGPLHLEVTLIGYNVIASLYNVSIRVSLYGAMITRITVTKTNERTEVRRS